MRIEFEEHEIELAHLQEIFNDLGPDALFYSHYELSEASEGSVTPEEWRYFLTDPRVADFLELEVSMMQQSAIRKMLRNIDQSNSPGKAQLLNTLVNQADKTKKKDGPIFIYTYIPLNEEEKHAPEVHVADSDPFKVSTEDGE